MTIEEVSVYKQRDLEIMGFIKMRAEALIAAVCHTALNATGVQSYSRGLPSLLVVSERR